MKRIKITERQAKLLGLIKTPKNTLKITQEQYDRIFGSKIVTEEVKINGGPKRMDRIFNKLMEEPIDIDKFDRSDLKKNIPSVPDSNTFMKESEGQEDLSTEFVKFLYGKGELSELWTEDKIREAIAKLSSKNLIIPTEDGNFKVSTSLGDPKTAMEAIKQELEAIKPQAEEMGQELIPMDSEQGLEEYGGPDDESNPTPTTIKTDYNVVGMNDEVAILNKNNKLFAFHFWDDTEKIKLLNARLQHHDNLDNISIDSESVENYINDASQGITNTLNIGKGLEYYKETEFNPIENEVNIVLIDEELKEYLLSLFGNDNNIVNVFSDELDENTDRDRVRNMLTKQVTQKPETKNTEETPEAKKARIMASLKKQRTTSAINDKIAADIFNAEKAKYRTDEEIDETMLGGAGGAMQSSGHNNVPIGNFVNTIKREIPTIVEKLNEMAAGPESTGEYTMPAFKMKKNHTDFADITTKAETTPLYPKGEFVEFNDCTKLNNKPAGSGCSAGAVDGVVKLKKASGSIISPSLAENKIYETIAAKTGKSIDEVKRIIKSKNGKA
jgi:hypothetical protein